MTTLASPSTNEIQNVIAVANSFERGTDTTITLTDGSAFPNAAHVIRIRNLDNTKWCLLIYTSKAGNVLTMGGGAADYALAKCVTVGDEAYEWPAGSIVELVSAADEIAQLFSEKMSDLVDDTTPQLGGNLDRNGHYIPFPAVANPSADVNTLDDYEEGTWTPAITFGGAAVDVTYDAVKTEGRYTKSGNVVHVVGRLKLTNKGSSNGAAVITGLPFTNAAGHRFIAPATLYFATITFANIIIGMMPSGVAAINFYEATEGGVITTITDANFANTSDISVNLTYAIS